MCIVVFLAWSQIAMRFRVTARRERREERVEMRVREKRIGSAGGRSRCLFFI